MKDELSAQVVRTAKLVVVVDDDPLVLEAMQGLLRGWGYRVVTASSDHTALAQLAESRQSADLIVCDYHLSEGRTGIEAIERLRASKPIPAFLISGDAAPDRLHEARARGYHVLHKPVDPKKLRALVSDVLGD
jgi:CheY-like chemotaxis protein